jgi:hypothetical protein
MVREGTRRTAGGSLGARASLVTVMFEAAPTMWSVSTLHREVLRGGSEQRWG